MVAQFSTAACSSFLTFVNPARNAHSLQGFAVQHQQYKAAVTGSSEFQEKSVGWCLATVAGQARCSAENIGVL